jgi:prolyl-tRNA synthetase
VVAKAEFADNGRGMMVIRPWAYAICERLQRELDDRKAAGVRHAYFPLLIPEDYPRREAEHVEGFSPELAVVTHGAGKQPEHPVVVRPTSETIINSYFAKWVASYRDRPLLVNSCPTWCAGSLPAAVPPYDGVPLARGPHRDETADEARAFALRILTDTYEEVCAR